MFWQLTKLSLKATPSFPIGNIFPRFNYSATSLIGRCIDKAEGPTPLVPFTYRRTFDTHRPVSLTCSWAFDLNTWNDKGPTRASRGAHPHLIVCGGAVVQWCSYHLRHRQPDSVLSDSPQVAVAVEGSPVCESAAVRRLCGILKIRKITNNKNSVSK